MPRRSVFVPACALGLLGALAPGRAHAEGGGLGAPPQQQQPPPVVVVEQQQQQPMVVQQQQPVVVQQQPVATPQPAPEESGMFGRRSAFGGVRGGPSLALGGPMADAGAPVGVWIGALTGVQTRYGLSASLSGNLRYHPGRSLNIIDLSFGGTFRYTLLQELVVHPWVEVAVELGYYAWESSRALGAREGEGWRFSAAGALGIEIDLTPHVSLDVGARAETIIAPYLWQSANTGLRAVADVDPGLDYLLTPFVGLTYYR